MKRMKDYNFGEYLAAPIPEQQQREVQ